jgi:hypothetical protein
MKQTALQARWRPLTVARCHDYDPKHRASGSMADGGQRMAKTAINEPANALGHATSLRPSDAIELAQA